MEDRPRNQATTTAVDELSWQTWDDPRLAGKSALRWKTLISHSGAATVGLAELPPRSILPLHHHAPAEVYHVLRGEAIAKVDGTRHDLRAGVSLFIPSDAKHRVTSIGTEPLRFLFMFPSGSFEEIDYVFDE